MKNLLVISAVAGYFFIYGCQPANSKIIAQKISVDSIMLDSMKAKADTFYSKRYPRTDLVLAEYYINRKDSTVTQLLKDNLGIIRQFIIEKNKVRLYTASFYANGQQMATYKLDNYGQYNDSSKEFFENGILKSEGIYKNGFHAGKWKNYDSTGKYLNTAEYNNDGQQINAK